MKANRFIHTGFLMILMICTHESRAGMHKPQRWFMHQPGFNWHVLNTDTIPPKKQGEAQKKEEPQKQEGEDEKPALPVKELPKSDTKTGGVINTIKQVPKSRKQPKPVAVQTPQLPVKIPVIKTPKVIIRKIKL